MRMQNAAPPARIKTRFLILSDTHSQSLFPSDDDAHAYREPLPKADVALHCGDLTYQGRLAEYRGVFRMLRSIDAELKLVIAGNHDKTLDGEYWSRKRPPRCDAQDHARAMKMWIGEEARAAGVVYLQEGIHDFTLNSGARLRVHVSRLGPIHHADTRCRSTPRHTNRNSAVGRLLTSTTRTASIPSIWSPQAPSRLFKTWCLISQTSTS